MSALAANFAAVRARIELACEQAGRDAADVQLLAVSKRHPADAVREAMREGQQCFGESRVQELQGKATELVADTPQWHLIGSLQTNKVRDLVRIPGLALVHSVDRRKLVDAMQRELDEADKSLDVLLQINASQEQQKHGCALEEAPALLEHIQRQCPRLRVQGLMAMAPLQGEPAPAFARTIALRDELRDCSGLPLTTLSLGMSGDLEAAIAAGSTMVRIGTALFGKRD